MKAFRLGSPHRRQAGAVLVETAVVVPLLIILAIPIFYVMWNINAQTVITNSAREMANLIARPVGYSKSRTMQEKMTSVAAMTPPFDLAKYGSIVVTEVEPDSGCSVGRCQGTIVHMWKWNLGAGPATSRWGQCLGSWDPSADGQCDKPSTDKIALPYSPPGKKVFIAEVNYQLPAWTGIPGFHIPGLNKDPLYAWAIF